MATLGTQNISDSFAQLLKVESLNSIGSTIQNITSGNNIASALALSTTEVKSTGSLTVDGSVTLSSTLGVTAACTLSSTLGVAGATTLSSTLGVAGATTLSSTLGVTGVATFSTSLNASSGTATIGTLLNNLATISTATISTMLGAVTYASTITASTGTSTIGTLSCSTATIGTETVGTCFGTVGSFSGLVTSGSFKVGAGSTLTSMTYTTATFTGATISDINTATNGLNISTGTFPMTGIGNSDIVLGGLTSLAGATGGTPGGLILTFRTEATNIARYTILNCSANTASTVSAGTIHATAFRYIL